MSEIIEKIDKVLNRKIVISEASDKRKRDLEDVIMIHLGNLFLDRRKVDTAIGRALDKLENQGFLTREKNNDIESKIIDMVDKIDDKLTKIVDKDTERIFKFIDKIKL